jgi:predicted NACHT family NTPase
LYNFRKKGLFLGGQNVISWGAQGGTGGAFAPPACMLKKALHEHHELFKIKQKKKGYMFEAKLPSELETDVIQLADIAKSELDQRKLEFELREDRVHLENCGLLVKIDDEFRNRYSFLHLTIQEYLAALYILFRSRNNINCISEFLKTKVNEPRWHLVID